MIDDATGTDVVLRHLALSDEAKKIVIAYHLDGRERIGVIDNVDAEILRVVEVSRPNEGDCYLPEVNQDGKVLAYLSRRIGRLPEVHVFREGGKRLDIAIPGEWSDVRSCQFSLSGDGQFLAASIVLASKEADERHQLLWKL